MYVSLKCFQMYRVFQTKGIQSNKKAYEAIFALCGRYILLFHIYFFRQDIVIPDIMSALK